jgi:hypothetical protein
MQWRLRLWFVLVGTSFWMASSPVIHAQCPQRSDDRGITQQAHATLSGELEEEAPALHVLVEDMSIDGAADLEESIRARIGDRLPEDGFASDSRWIDALQEIAREVLRDNGYLLGKVHAQARVLSRDSVEEHVSVRFQ